MSEKTRTLFVVCFAQQKTGLGTKNNGTIGRGDRGPTVTQVSLEFVYVVGAFAASASVLAIYRVDA